MSFCVASGRAGLVVGQQQGRYADDEQAFYKKQYYDSLNERR
jgi:hypothetical protein